MTAAPGALVLVVTVAARRLPDLGDDSETERGQLGRGLPGVFDGF